MRLIDADALIAVICAEFCHVAPAPDKPCAGCHMLEEIAEAPTIEAEPVRHGRWAYTHHMSSMACVTGHVRCIACNRMRPRLIGDVLKYCPHCGAKMDGDSHAGD